MLLEGKSAIITGGVRGIGRGIAEAFCKEGANVVLVYRSNDEAAEATRAALAAYGTGVELVKGDVASMETAKEAVARCKETFGSVDILVNNAGITKDKLLLKMSDEDFGQVVDINLKGSFNFLQAAGSVMMKQRHGAIINMASISGVMGNPGQVNYSASKAGVIGMTKAAAKELGRRHIRVNAIAPGFIETDMTAELPAETQAEYKKSIPAARFASANEVAKVVTWIAGDDAGYISGAVIPVDGGLGMGH
jgi:3-oxoacyl-[acyl-carrier protein] reductase